MRRWLVLAVLFGAMFGLDALKADTDGTHDPMVLAAIGFVLLASFTVAELGGSLGLPKVTGYILGGAALGPSVANILSPGVVAEMRMFNTLALGLIATGAGLELDVKQIAGVFKTLAATIGLKILLGVTAVGGTFLVMQGAFGLLPLETSGQTRAIALVLGVLSIGTSPAIALAIMTESRAKGRMTDLVLGAAVLKDLVVVVCLAIALAIAKTWVAPETSGGESVLVLVGKELGGSLLAGAVLGVLLILYIRFVRAEMLLFVAAMILVVSEVARSLHLELLLVFITAGFVVRNLSDYEHDLMSAVQMVALPVFVVFFTIAGAGVDLAATWQILPLAIALCVARAGAYYFAARAGGGFGKEGPVIRSQAWLGYLPQAGVTLGLVGLAANQLPSVAAPLQALGMAVVAINLLVGPITLKRALKSAGDIPDDAKALEPEASHTKGSAAHGDPPDATDDTTEEPERPSLPPDEIRSRLGAVKTRVGDSPVGVEALTLHGELDDQLMAFHRDVLSTWSTNLQTAIAQAVESPDTLSAWAAGQHERALTEQATRLRELFQSLRARIHELPASTRAPVDPELLARNETDGAWTAWLKFRARVSRVVTFGQGWRTRSVPVRAIARVALEPELAASLQRTLESWTRAQLVTIEHLGAVAADVESREDVTRALAADMERFLVEVEADLRTTLVTSLEHQAELLATVGGPASAPDSVRPYQAEERVRTVLGELTDDEHGWPRVLGASLGLLRMRLEVRQLEQQIHATLESTVLESASPALESVRQILERTRQTLAAVRERAKGTEKFGPETRLVLVQACRDAYPPDVELQLEGCAARFRSAASVHAVTQEARRFVEQLPTTRSVPRAETPAHRARAPGDVRIERIALRSYVEETLSRELFPGLDAQLEASTTLVATTSVRIREAVDISVHALETVPDAPTAEALDVLARGMQRALGRLDEQVTTLANTSVALSSAVREHTRHAFDELAQVGGLRMNAADTTAGGPGARLARWLAPTQRVTRRFTRVAGEFKRILLGSDFSRGVQLRYRGSDVDALQVRALVDGWTNLGTVPEAYGELFSSEPVRDHRLFTANGRQLETLLETERSSLAGRQGSALVLGRRGSGRTSLLNLLELEASAPRVLRPRPLEWRRSLGAIPAIAIELGLPPRSRRVKTALRDVRTTVLLDDLEHWFAPDAQGMEDLARLLELIVQTDDSVFWVVAVETSTLALLEEMLPIRPAFSRVVELKPLSATELKAAIEGRHALSGRPIDYPTSLATRLLSRLGGAAEEDVYHRFLGKTSAGNLAAALQAWLRSARIASDGSVRPELSLGLSAASLLLSQLPVRQLAALGQLARFGPMSESELAVQLRSDEGELRRHVHFLVASGVLVRDAQIGERLRVAGGVQPLVSPALEQAGVVRGLP